MSVKPPKRFEDYIRLFEINDMPFFVNDTLLQNYKNLNCLFINRKNTWTCFIPKIMSEITGKEGLSLYGDKEKFEKYRQEFEEYKQRSTELFSLLVKKDKFGVVDIDSFLNEVNRLHSFYLRTEFFYTDEAFQQSRENEVIKENLKHLDHIKNSGREYLNKVFFGEESWIRQFFLVLSRQHYIKESDLWQHTQQEVRNLPKTKPGESVLKERQGSYIVTATPENEAYVFGKEAEELIEGFFSTEKLNKQELKGMVANKGLVKGPVKVIKYGYKDFDQLHKQIEEMGQGDVLVAETTSPELTIACHKAAAIITNQGGLMSHAAIISRELGIPCIVGTGDATEVLRDGDLVEVNADKGTISKL